MFNLTISQQQLQLFIKYSKFFRSAIVDICTFKGAFSEQLLSVNLTISQQLLHLLIKYSKYFRKAIVNICTCKGDFRKSYFLQRAALSEHFQNGCSHPFFQGLHGPDNFRQQLLINTSYFLGRH